MIPFLLVACDTPLEQVPPQRTHVVTPAGGTFTFDHGIVVDIPEGAVPGGFRLTVSPSDAPVPEGHTSLSPLFRFEPEGLTFDRPIDVFLPFEGTAEQGHFYWGNGQGGFYQPRDVSIEPGGARLSVDTLAPGFIGLQGPVEEITVYDTPPPVDVVLAIGNRGTMPAEQAALDHAYITRALFATAPDARLGITTLGGPLRGQLLGHTAPRYIDATTASADEVFGDLVQIGTASERQAGRSALYDLLEPPHDVLSEDGMLRPEADLHVLFVSDRDDATNDLDPQLFLDWLDTARPFDQRFVVHAITPSRRNCFSATARGDKYIGYAEHTGGRFVDLCSPMWTSGVREILTTLDRKTQIPLHQDPGDDMLLLDMLYEDGTSFPYVGRAEYVERLGVLRLDPGLRPGDTLAIRYTPSN